MKFAEDVTIEHDGKRYTLTAAELCRCAEHEAEWLPAGDWSSWMVEKVYSAAKATGAPKPAARELTARALGVTVERVNASLEWHVKLHALARRQSRLRRRLILAVQYR